MQNAYPAEYPGAKVNWYADAMTSIPAMTSMPGTAPNGIPYPNSSLSAPPTAPNGILPPTLPNGMASGMWSPPPTLPNGVQPDAGYGQPFNAFASIPAGGMLSPTDTMASTSPMASIAGSHRHGGGDLKDYLKSEYGRPNRLVSAQSFFTNAAAEGFFGSEPSSPSKPGPSFPSGVASGASSGALIVNVDTALDLTPADGFGAHYYCATAHYVGEPEDEVRHRYTQVVKANASSTDQRKENCVLHKRITVPYNPRQQFVMVDILEGPDQLDDGTFIGQATLPLADPRLASTAPWPLIRDGVQTGVVTLNIQIPGGDSSRSGSRPAVIGSPRASSPSRQGSLYGPPPPRSSFSHDYGALGNPTKSLPTGPPDPLTSFPQAAPSALQPSGHNNLNPTMSLPTGPPDPLTSFPPAAPSALQPSGRSSLGPTASLPTGPPDPLASFPSAAPSAQQRMGSPGRSPHMSNLNPTVSFPAVGPSNGSFPALAPSASKPPLMPPAMPGSTTPRGTAPLAPSAPPSTWESPKMDNLFSGFGLNGSAPAGNGSYLAPPLPNLLGNNNYMAPSYGNAGMPSLLGARGGAKSWTPAPANLLGASPSAASSMWPASGSNGVGLTGAAGFGGNTSYNPPSGTSGYGGGAGRPNSYIPSVGAQYMGGSSQSPSAMNYGGASIGGQGTSNWLPSRGGSNTANSYLQMPQGTASPMGKMGQVGYSMNGLTPMRY